MKKKILIVDTRDDFIEYCQPTLKEKNYIVEAAYSYDEALQKTEEFKPDAIVSALMLDHYDSGFVLAYKVKKMNPNILFYILTSAANTTGIQFSLTTDEEKQWILADGFLHEPMRIEDLIDLMNTHFERHKEELKA